MKIQPIITLLFFQGIALNVYAQQRVGINTTTPVRPLEIAGTGVQWLRVHSVSPGVSHTGLELLRGGQNNTIRDWKVENANGQFMIKTTLDNFDTDGTRTFTIDEDHRVAIGSQSPASKLHVTNGVEASNTENGYMMLGNSSGANLVFDGNEIISRNNGQPATLFIQPHGGHTWFGNGNIRMGFDGGRARVGTGALSAKFTVDGSEFQLRLRNNLNGVNDWFIGATNPSWLIGGDQLVFSPTSSSSDAVLRLKDVSDNNGTEAPVMITAPSTQHMLLDGNEIDTNTPLYINHNSDEDTYINPSSGLVGIGTASPSAKLHVVSGENGMAIQRDNQTWTIQPTAAGNLNFYRNGIFLAYVSWNGGGSWVAVSDERLKENILPLSPVLEKIRELNLYAYRYIHDDSGRRDIGVIAQELENLFPETVSVTADRYTVSYDQLTVIAIKGLQEQRDELNALMKQADELLAKK